MKRLAVIGIILGMSACTARLVTPTEADVERGKTTYPNLTLAQLHEGKALYEEHCDACHKLKRPEDESVEEWKKIMPEMAVKAKINSETEQKILQYVLTMHDAKKKK